MQAVQPPTPSLEFLKSSPRTCTSARLSSSDRRRKSNASRATIPLRARSASVRRCSAIAASSGRDEGLSRMSARHPIISITGSSGAGTTSVKQIFEHIFRREKIEAAFIEGDAFHRYDRAAMKEKVAEEERKGNPNFTHFNAEANELAILESVFEQYGRKGTGRTRTYVHDEEEAASYGQPPGSFTPWRDFPASDLLFYEGLHGCAVHGDVDLARHADLRIGVVPVVNLEWIQKIHRDRATRGYS